MKLRKEDTLDYESNYKQQVNIAVSEDLMSPTTEGSWRENARR